MNMNNSRVHCEIRGQKFPSLGSAARHFGLSRQAVQSALDRGGMDGVGLGRNHWSKKTTFVDGKQYQSMAEVAEAYSLPSTTVRNWILRAKRRGEKSVETKIGTITWAGVI